MTESQSDEQLLAAMVSGQTDALRCLYRRHVSLVYAIAHSICGQDSDAQAVTSQVFIELWKSPDNYHPQRGSLRTYLTILTRSRARDHLRRSRAGVRIEASLDPQMTPTVESLVDSTEPSQNLAAQEDAQQVRRCLAGLSDDSKSALTLAFFQGHTHREIAQKLKLPLGTVKSHIRRGLADLADRLRTDTDSGTREH
ncbi:sigma-70 family RNA polymerase sigma factor [Crateriforma conspicua]|uniref:ECF RNA polymerase sigma factor SigE n=1 Tax=Crateriforma conspicua TaxID=2527996 RepID=A0A5C6FUZ9_9PLAN|nr:sigma-70 family RNA polymerase sigma factor [Crateriforma conspicua]TWU66201.1 ECF RNA polymerase sigma factor SigE [Crateriforma conspicua]